MRLLQQNIGTCNNRENCIPISLFDDATWHVVEVNVAPTANGGAVITFDFDAGAYGGFALASDYTLPEPAYDPCIIDLSRTCLSPLPCALRFIGVLQQSAPVPLLEQLSMNL